MAMVNQVNPVISQHMYNPNVKDSRWLTLEVCREYQRSKCSRTENECKFAHPPPHVEVQNGRVTCCFDSIKGKCQRKEPPCKYLHPPQHLKEQLLQNGRNNLAMRNLQIHLATTGVPPMVQGSVYSPVTHPYMVQNPSYPYAPVANMPGILSGVDAAGNPTTSMPVTGVPTSAAPTMQSMMPATISQQPKLQRPDRLETSSSSNGSEPTTWTTSHPESITPVSQYSPVYFQNTIGTMPTIVPMMKRHAVDNKSGMPMYQPSTGSAAYQQAALAMQLQQQQFAPVTLTSHPAGMPRF